MNICLIAYSARSADDTTQLGVARVITERTRPSWSECASQIPGFVTGSDLGPAPIYTLRYNTPIGAVEKQLDHSGVERIGTVVMRVANRGKATNIAVLDATGQDVTFDFACFCV